MLGGILAVKKVEPVNRHPRMCWKNLCMNTELLTKSLPFLQLTSFSYESTWQGVMSRWNLLVRRFSLRRVPQFVLDHVRDPSRAQFAGLATSPLTPRNELGTCENSRKAQSAGNHSARSIINAKSSQAWLFCFRPWYYLLQCHGLMLK